MCRDAGRGGRRCRARQDALLRARENIRRRITRNTAKAAFARENGADRRADHYDALVEKARVDLDLNAQQIAAHEAETLTFEREQPPLSAPAPRPHALACAPAEPVTLDLSSRPINHPTAPAGNHLTVAPTGAHSSARAATFHHPLHVEHGAPGEHTYWPDRLSAYYDGYTGQDLSRAIADDGYDAVLATDQDGRVIVVDLRAYHPAAVR